MSNSLLPPNATDLMLALEQIEAERLDAIALPHRQSLSATDCPEVLLPWLAWERSVDVWRDHWSTDTKRAVIDAAPALHRHKGTAQAVRDAVQAIGSDLDIFEWWQPGGSGDPYTFHVRLHPENSESYDLDFQHALMSAIDASKNTRSHYTIEFNISTSQILRIGGRLTSASLVLLKGAPA